MAGRFSNLMFCQNSIFLQIEESRFWIEILPNRRIRHFGNNSKEKRTIQPHVDAQD